MPDHEIQPSAGKDEPEAPGKLSRRDFLSQLGTSSVVVGSMSMSTALVQVAEVKAVTASPPDGFVQITLTVNGAKHTVQIDPRSTLLDTLRETLHLTGTKKGCDHGQCGACTIHVNGRRVNSCLAFAVMQQNAEITTIEGLAVPIACIR